MRTGKVRPHGLVVAIGLALASAPSGAAASIIVGGDTGKVSIGSGYDPVAQRMVDICIDGVTARLGGDIAWMTSGYTNDLDTMRHNVDSYGSAGVDIGILGASKSVEYFARVAHDDEREGIILSYQVQLGSFVLRPNVDLNEYGRGVATMEDAYARRLRCGTEFVQQVDLGYRLRIAVTATFRSRSAHEHFKERRTVSALFGLIKKTSESVREIKAFGQDLVIEVSALQEGGRQDRLAQVLGGKTVCAAAEVESCADLAGRVLAYASADADGFRAQMADADVYHPSVLAGPAVLRYATSTYEEAGVETLHTAQAPVGDLEALRDVTRRLQAVILKLTSDEQKAAALLQGAALSEVRRARLHGLKQQILVLSSQVRETLTACGSGETAAWCSARATEAEQSEHALDRSAVGAE